MSQMVQGRRSTDNITGHSMQEARGGRRATDRMARLPLHRRIATRMLCRYIPERMKRLIFLSSVVGLIENISTPDKTFIAKLNAILKLAHDDDAIAFPMYIHSWLWKKCEDDVCIEINGKELPMRGLANAEVPASYFTKIASYLINNAPQWIVYGNEKRIADDLELLFSSIPRMSRG